MAALALLEEHLVAHFLEGEESGGVTHECLVVIVLQSQAGDVLQTLFQGAAGPLLGGTGRVIDSGAEVDHADLRDAERNPSATP